MSKFSGFFKKLKSIKHIEVIVAVLLALVVLLVFFSSSNAINQAGSSNSAMTYSTKIENKLESLLEQIEGAGEVNVMIMCDGETENAKIVSAVVVSSGAGDVFVRLEIIKAVQALLNLDAKNIEVLKGGG